MIKKTPKNITPVKGENEVALDRFFVFKVFRSQLVIWRFLDLMPSDTRCRVYTCILYPESAKVGWFDKLCEFGIKCAVSPLHDKDLSEDGNVKKAHFHLLFQFDNKKTIQSFEYECALPLGAVRCQPVRNIKSFTRYLCHLDNPEKAAYLEGDVVSLNGFNYERLAAQPQCYNEKVIALLDSLDTYNGYSVNGFLHFLRSKNDNLLVFAFQNTAKIRDVLRSKMYDDGKF